ncbi:MAG TPA: hypothetical protein VNA25_20015 [Phycisphaerae bacterium]|nr:hypothetical protein [Phycisphaerae bacterium]HUT60138.1 hypothetical protein [Phycisphaerae bacterium]
MAQEHQELRSVNWNEVFGFTHIFKCFRMAIQPSKLLLSAAALILLFLAGWGLDLIWSSWGGYVEKDEIARHAGSPPAAFDQYMDKRAERLRRAAAQLKVNAFNNRHSLEAYMGCIGDAAQMNGISLAQSDLQTAFVEALNKYNQDKDKDYKAPDLQELLKEKGVSTYDLIGDADEQLDVEVDKIEEILKTARKEAETAVKKKDTKKREAEEALDDHLAVARQAITLRKLQHRNQADAIRGLGVAKAFVTYEWNCVRKAVNAVRHGRITSGLDEYKALMARRRAAPPIAADTVGMQAPMLQAGNADLFQAAEPAEGPGVLLCVLMAYRGGVWLIQTHWVYAIVYLVIAMAICAVFGGAVNRIAALHFAREEKISVGQALKFSLGKFFSFFTAPLIPIAIILVLGLLLLAGGLIINIPVIGEIIAGVLFFLALLLGLGIAFLLVGVVGGAGLMYPTIAVEGSDSFDAISRSYSYVFAKPWRAIFYGLVALVYGVITYLFVRLFAFLALLCTHYFVKWGVFVGGGSLSPQADKLDVIWTAPTYDRLFGPFSWDAMGGGESIGAFLIGIWVFIVAAVVAGYLLSYAASATTVIYYLLRRKVDATDLDDVYVEEAPEPAEPTTEAPAEPAPEAPAEAEAAPESPATEKPESDQKPSQ